jgi:hypothetical protein
MSFGSPDPATLGPLARKVLHYGEVMERTVVAAKQPGFNEVGWDELAVLLNTDKFQRVGNDREEMGWVVYRNLLAKWATATDFWAQFHRISEIGNVVFLELTEHNIPRGGTESVVNSMSVYAFDEAGKLVHLDIYLQHD